MKKIIDDEAKLDYARHKGREEGQEEGREESREEGRQEGRDEGKIEVILSGAENGLDVATLA